VADLAGEHVQFPT